MSKMYLKVGPIKGSSGAKSSTGQIELIHWGFNMSHPFRVSSDASGSTGAAGELTVSDFKFAKKQDDSSNVIVLAIATSTHFAEATLSLFKTEGTKDVLCQTMVFEEVTFTNWNFSASQGQTEFYEEISFTYNKVISTFIAEGKDGKAGDNKVWSYDRVGKEAG